MKRGVAVPFRIKISNFGFSFQSLGNFSIITSFDNGLVSVGVILTTTDTYADPNTHFLSPQLLSCLSLSPSGGLEPLASDWLDSPGEVQDHRSVSLLLLWIFLQQTKPRPPTCSHSRLLSSARQQNRRSFASRHSGEGRAKLLLIIETGAHRRGHAACSRCVA